jgi:hypothetical protein
MTKQKKYESHAAVRVRYLGATDRPPSRLVAEDVADGYGSLEPRRITVEYPQDCEGVDAYAVAAEAWAEKFLNPQYEFAPTVAGFAGDYLFLIQVRDRE